MATLVQSSVSSPLLLPESVGRTAKASLRKAENRPLDYVDLGACMAEVMRAFGLSLKEFARELGKNERQVARQLDGAERPQLESVLAVPRFQPALVIALATRAHGVVVDTVIHVRRTA